MRREWVAVALLVSALSVESGVGATSTTSEDELAAAIRAREWPSGRAVCAELPEREARRPNRRDAPAARYAMLAVRCAAIHQLSGDLPGFEWWWYTAMAMDAHAAALEAQDLAASSSFAPIVLRVPGGDPPTALDETHVRRVDGSVVGGVPPKRLEPKRPPKYFFEPVPGVKHFDVAVEAILGDDGVLRQPLLVSAHALPVHAFLAFAVLREWRYAPARIDDQPTATLVRTDLSWSSGAG